MKKILHVSYGGLGCGGVSTVILSIVKSLYTQFEFGCVVFHLHGTRENDFLKYGKLHRLNCYKLTSVCNRFIDLLLRPFKMTYGVYKICKLEKYDVVHCHNGSDMLFALLGAKFAGVPTRIAHSHTTILKKKGFNVKRAVNVVMYFFIKKLATILVGCSEQACLDYFGKSSSKVIYNSIDLAKFHWKKMQRDNLSFIHVGRYEIEKNQKFVIDIFEILKNTFPSASLRLVGFGKDEVELKKIVDVRKLGNSVFFVDGRLSSIPDLLSDSDFMIFPSLYEGFGIVLLEAQASGCFCFASNVCPSKTNVGFMMQIPLSLNAEQWAKKITECILSEDFLDEKVVCENLKEFSLNNISKRYFDLYA